MQHTPVNHVFETPAGNYWQKEQKIITEIMVSELNVLQRNSFHHHVPLAIHASALVWAAKM
jgi:hypothetical protein